MRNNAKVRETTWEYAKDVDGVNTPKPSPALLPDHAAQGLSGLSDAKHGVAVDELDVAELSASPAALDEAHPNKPSIDHSCWGRTPDRGLVIGEHASFLVDPAAEVGESGAQDHMSFQLAPLVEGTAIGEAFG